MPLMIVQNKFKLVFGLIISLGLSWGLVSCSVLQSALPSGSDQADGDGQYVSQEQALESGEGDSLDDYNPDNPGDVSSAALVCPKDPTEFVLFLSHSWDFSPNRELDKMRVNGQTEPSSPCPFTVAGNTVLMEECRVPITNTGFIQTDGGPCDITSSGSAIITIDDASCDGGKITMTIVETIDPDSGSGAMNCPELSQPYFPFFPFSRTTRTFQIQVGGATASEVADPDLTNQFMYNKEWTIHAEGLESGTGTGGD